MAELITREMVDVASRGKSAIWLEPVRAACNDWEINTKLEAEMFLAQCAHESVAFSRLVEDLRYSAKRLVEVWPKRFTLADAQEMAGDEFAIGERVYGGRMGNGVEGSGDGFLFRGRGLIQLTGRANYASLSEYLGVDLTQQPELLSEDPLWAAYASAVFWDTNGCGDAANAGDYLRVTRIINGGTTGYQDRLAWLRAVQAA
jgi:putative chitinase